MQKKSILILGASELQIPGIRKAQEMGLECIAVDYDENAAGIDEADIFYNISTLDTENILKVAKKHDVAGIFTICSDRPMRVVSEVAGKLGLNAISEESALFATNKAHMRNAFNEKGVPIPEFRVCSSYEDYKKAVSDIGFPAIVKPSDNAGSRGISFLDTNVDIDEAYEYARTNSLEGVVLVEEFLTGAEVSVEAFVNDGAVTVVQITDKITTGAPHFVEMGHNQPSAHDEATLLEIKDVTRKAVESLKIKSGPIHAEMKITENGVKVIELGARLGGDHISTDLVKLSTGVDLVEANINWALNEPFDIETKCSNYAAIRYVGKLSSVKLDQNVLKDVDYFAWDRIEADEIKSSRDRECCFIVSAATKDGLETKIKDVSKAISKGDKIRYW